MAFSQWIFSPPTPLIILMLVSCKNVFYLKYNTSLVRKKNLIWRINENVFVCIFKLFNLSQPKKLHGHFNHGFLSILWYGWSPSIYIQQKSALHNSTVGFTTQIELINTPLRPLQCKYNLLPRYTVCISGISKLWRN